MLVSREELKFDFKGAQFDLKSEEDRKLLAWIFNQFLYGEASGIQCGLWLYRAPSVQAASFLAKQAGEELSHFRRILRIFSILGEKPQKAHPAIRFLSSGMMGSTWGEHVTIEMALGEGLVLSVFYAMLDTIPQPEIQKILSSAIVEEERHVEFGEREALAWLKAHPHSRKFLLGLALVQLWVLQRLKKFVLKKVLLKTASNHPVLQKFERFYDQAVKCFEIRIERLGLSTIPLRELSTLDKLKLVLVLPFQILFEKIKFKKPLLTESYLNDACLEAEESRHPLSSLKHE